MAPSPTEIDLISQELSKRINEVEHNMHNLQLQIVEFQATLLAELRAIKDTMNIIVAGENANCMRHSSRIASLEEKMEKKVDEVDFTNLKRSMYGLWAVVGTLGLTFIGALIKHILG